MAGTTNDKLNLLRQIKEAFRAAITGKGQTISADEPFSAWPAKVAAITSGGEMAKAFTIMPSADTRTLSVTGLSKADYGYLLGCDTLMIYGETDTTTSRYYICSAYCHIGAGVDSATNPNRAIACSSTKTSETYNLFTKVAVTEESGGISVTITTDAATNRYFAGDVTYSIVGLKI